MPDQTDTLTVNPLGFSEWSTENAYDDPLESRLKFGDYLREEYIKGGVYTPAVEGGIRKGFAESLQAGGLLEPDGANAEELESRIGEIETGTTFDQLARTFQRTLPEHDPDQQTLDDYFTAASVESPTEEYLVELQPLREKANDVVSRRQDQLLHTRVDSGELPMARLSDGQLLVGDAAASMDLVAAIKASSSGGVTMRDAMAAEAQLATPDGWKLPLYRIKKVVAATGLLEAERKENETFNIVVDGLSTELAESEYDWKDRLGQKADAAGRIVTNFFGRIMGQGEDIDKATARREAVEEARGTNLRQLASKYALKFDMRPDVMEAALQQMVHDNATNKQMLPFFDRDDPDVGKNIRFTGFGLPSVAPQALINKDVFDKSIAAHPDMSDEVKDMLNKQRVNKLRSEFGQWSEFLSDSNVSDEWNTALIAGRSSGVADYKILEGFTADEDNYNEFAERAAGVGMSIVSGFGQLLNAIPAAFGFEPSKDYLASVSQKSADRRQLATVFGEEFGIFQDAAETAFPMLIDVAATTLLAVATAPAGGAGGVAYASLKAGGSATASMTAKGMFKAITSNVFRKTAAKSTVDQAEDLIAANLIKGSTEGAVGVLKSYNSKLSAHLGNLPAIFIPSATRSGAATYGAVYNQLKQDPNVSDDDAHDRALGSMLMAGTFTGILTSAFSTIGRGGLEDALLKGLTFKQMNTMGKSITGKLDGDLLSAAKKAITAVSKKYAFGGLKGVGKSVLDEGIEEGIDEFVNSLITDAALHENTPMLERLQQTFHAFVLGGMMGGSVPVIQMGFRSMRPAALGQRETSLFYDEILEEMVTDLTENGAPITAEYINALTSDMRKKDARASMVPTLEEQETQLRRGEPEAPDATTQLPSGITTPDPEMEALLEEKVNPDSVATAMSEILARSVPVVAGADPTTVEAKGDLMHQLELPLEEASSIENSDHQAVRGLLARVVPEGVDLDRYKKPIIRQKRTIFDPARAEEAEAIEAGFREETTLIDKAAALYKKMEREVSLREVAGESSVRRALDKRVREGTAVSPEDAVELKGDAFKARVLALKELKVEQDYDQAGERISAIYEKDYLRGLSGETSRETDFDEDYAPAETAPIYDLVRSGFPQVLTVANLKRLGVPVNQNTSSASFLREANHQIQRQISEFYPKIPVSRPEGGMALATIYGGGKVFLDRFGVGQFNNDPSTMLSLLETGAPIVVSPSELDSPTINPAFRFAQVGSHFVVTDIMLPESGGLVSALTPADHVLILKPDYTRLVNLIERVTALRDKGLREPDAMVDSPFEPETKIPASDALAQLDEDSQKPQFIQTPLVGRILLPPEERSRIDSFLSPTKGELAPEFVASAQTELRLRAQEALFNGDNVSLDGLGREVADLYVAEQASRLKHLKESFVSTVSVNEAAELQGDPDFNVASEVEDTYNPFPETTPPPFPSSSISDLLTETQSDAVAAIAGDPSLRQSIVLLVQNEVFTSSSVDFSRTSTKRLWGHIVQWMAQGNSRSNSASIEFQKALKEGRFEMGTPVREALQLMALSSSSIEGTPKTNTAYRELIRSKVRVLKGGAAPSDAEVHSFFNYVRQSTGELMLRSQPTAMSLEEVQRVNREAIAALGLKAGDPESVVEALRRIVGVSDRAQMEYDSHLGALARLLLQSPDFIRGIELSIDETTQNYAGQFDILDDGTPAISININGHNPRGVADTLLHELIHAYVDGVIRKPAAEQTLQERSAIGTLEKLIVKIKAEFETVSSENVNVLGPQTRTTPAMPHQFHDQRVYDALENVNEFVAHFLTSTDFQNTVRVLLSEDAGSLNLFQQAIAAIRALFRGTNAEFDAAFSAVLDLSHSSVLAAGARRRSKRDLISVEEFLTLPNKESRTAKDFIADKVFPPEPATHNTARREPVTVDSIVGKIADDVSRSQREAVELSSGVQGATGVDVDAQQRGQESMERVVILIRSVVPPEVRVELDHSLPTKDADGKVVTPSMMSVNSETGTLTVNPFRVAGLIASVQAINGGRPLSMRTQVNLVAVVVNEEIAHAASIAVITRPEQDEIINGMTYADAEEAMKRYGDEGNVDERERLLQGWRDGNRDDKVQVMEEMLRQHAQKVVNGFTTEEEVAFLRRNPTLIQYIVRYFQRFLKKLGYYRSRRNISPQLRVAVDRVVNEVRALEAGYRHTSNFRPFDPNNPETVIEQFKKQVNMNKAIERPDAAPALASGITDPDIDLWIAARDKDFDRLATGQRGKPESAMMKLTMYAGGGVYSFIAEHIGDLTHRMSERFSSFQGGESLVRDKVEKTLRVLRNDYGFEKEMRENEQVNATVEKRALKEHRETVREFAQQYADEHKKLPTFNKLQRAARAAAVALGEFRFKDVISNLEILEKSLADGSYDEQVGQYFSDTALASGITVQVPTDAANILDGRNWEKIGPQLGSNTGGMYEDKATGKKYYFKESQSPEHARNEVLATVLYETVGANILPLRLTTGRDADGNDVLGTASEWREDFTEFDPQDPAMRKAAYPDFAIHAWLANWDVVGLEYDNLMVDGEGRVVHVDTGGALEFRAQGEPKGGAWNEEGSEFETLREMGEAAEVFADMTTSDLQNSAAPLRNMTDAVILTAVDRVMAVHSPRTGRVTGTATANGADMANTLIERRDNILNMAGHPQGEFASGITVPPITVGNFEFDGVFPDDLEYKRYSDGRFKGAPLHDGDTPLTEKDVEKLEGRLKKLAVEGAVGRFWYEDAAKKILEITNGDVVETEKLIALLAIYSPQTGVGVNTMFAIRAYEQHANNVPRGELSVKTEVQDEKARAVLYDNKDWKGRKTDNFYKNLMFHIVSQATPEQLNSMRIDPAFLEDIQQPVTVDMWVYRAVGYDTIGLTDEKGEGAFGFSEKIINRLTYSLNQNLAEGEPRYEAHQVQAMVWTAIKARSEQKAVKQKTEAESIKAKDMIRRGPERIFTKRPVTKTVKGVKKEVMSSAPSERAHQRRWTENALAATGVDFVEASRSFDYFVDSMGLTATWEVVASTETEIGKRLAAMSFDEKRAFTERAMKLIVDPQTGEDLLAKELGISLSTTEVSAGGYAGGVTPNVLSTLYPNKPKDVGGKETYDDDAIRAYARGLQYIFMQDAVPWARFVKKTKQDVHYKVSKAGKTAKGGARFDTQEEAEKFAASKNAKIDAGKVVKVDGGYQIQTSKDKPYKLKNKDTGKLEEVSVFEPKVTEDPKLSEQEQIDAADKGAKEAAETFITENILFVAGGNEQSHGFRLTFNNDLTESELQDIQDFLTSMNSELGFTQIGVNQIIVINYKIDYMGMLPVLTDGLFAAKINQQYGQEAELKKITTVGEYGYHDWGSDPVADGLFSLSPRFGPDVQTWIRSRRERFQQIAAKPEEGELASGLLTQPIKVGLHPALPSGITSEFTWADVELTAEQSKELEKIQAEHARILSAYPNLTEDEKTALTQTQGIADAYALQFRDNQEDYAYQKSMGYIPDSPPPQSERVQQLRERLQPLVDRAVDIAGFGSGLLSSRQLIHGTPDAVPTVEEGEAQRGDRPKIDTFQRERASRYWGLVFFTQSTSSANEFIDQSDRGAGHAIIPVVMKADMEVFDPRVNWQEFMDEVTLAAAKANLTDPREQRKAVMQFINEPTSYGGAGVAFNERNLTQIKDGQFMLWERPLVVEAIMAKYDGMLVTEGYTYEEEDRQPSGIVKDEHMNLAIRNPHLVKSSAPITLDSGGNIIPLHERFNPASPKFVNTGITFGDASDLPSEFNADGVDYSQFIEVLEMPLIEAGGFQKVGSTFKKLFKGETDPTVQRFVRQRDAFLRTSGKVVEEYHFKYKDALEKDFASPDDIPWDDIQAATGTTDNIDPDPDGVLMEARDKEKDAAHTVYHSAFAAAHTQHILDEAAEIANIKATEPDKAKRKTLYKAARDSRQAKDAAAKDALKTTLGAAYETAQQKYTDAKDNSFATKKADMIKDRNEAFSRLRKTAPNLFPVLLDLRRLTDELSKMSKKLFGVFSKKDLSVKFDNNMGIYVTRTYQMFSDTDYVDRILLSDSKDAKAIRAAAIDYMRNQFVESEYDKHRQAGVSESDARIKAEDTYNSREKGTQSLGYQMIQAFLRSYTTEAGASDFATAFDLAEKPATTPSRMSDALKAITKNLEDRSAIPKPLADLMGANNVPEDSVDALLYTLGTVSKIAAHQSFLNAMREQGVKGKWLITATQREEALKKAKSKEEYNAISAMKPIISSGADSGLNPLAGLYAAPDVYDSIRPMFHQTTRDPDDAASQALRATMRMAQRATGTAMALKTLGSIGFYLRNMLGNVLFFGPAQGYYSAGASLVSGDPSEGTGMSAWRGAGRAWQGNKAQTSAYLRGLESLGVFGDEVRSEIMIRLIRGEETHESVQAQLEELNKKLTAKNVAGNVWRETHQKATRLASAMDSFYKIGYFEHELAVIEEAAKQEGRGGRYYEMKPHQRRQHAADIISATSQSYARALPIIKKISGSGWGLLFAPFIRFTAEVPRIAVNTFTLARKEMKDANPVIKSRGMRRLQGLSLITFVSTALPALLGKLLSDIGEDEDEAFRMSLPSYLRNHTFYYFKKKDGTLLTYDLTYLNPFAVIADPLLRGMEHLFRGEPFTAAEKMVESAFLSPYLGDQILAGAIVDVKENRNARTNMPITEETDPLWRKLSKKVGYVMKEAYGPRTPATVLKAIEAAQGDSEEWADSPWGIIVNDSMPVRPRTNDPAAQFSKVVYQLRGEQQRVQQQFGQLKQTKGLSESAVRKIHRDIRKSRMRINTRLSQAMRGFRGLGVSNLELYQSMKGARYGDRRSRLLFAGFMENPVPTPDLVKSLMRTPQGQQRLKWLMEEHAENPRFLRLED